MPDRRGRGGRREGAGRKPLGPSPLVRADVRLPAEWIEPLRELGKGSLSEGVRLAVARSGVLHRTEGSFVVEKIAAAGRAPRPR